jgi:hypothetical protein
MLVSRGGRKYPRLRPNDGYQRARASFDLSATHGWVLLVEAQLALGELGGAEQVAERALERAEAASLPQTVADLHAVT